MHENCKNDQTKDNEWDTVDSKAECGTKKCSTDNATHTADKDNQEEGKNPFQNSPEHSILVFSYPTHRIVSFIVNSVTIHSTDY